MEKRYILTADLGTTSIRTFVYDIKVHKFVSVNKRSNTFNFPHPGWVEQDAWEMAQNIKTLLKESVANLDEDSIIGLGITNQRETIVAWDKDTFEPLAPAIVWQDHRTQDFCNQLGKKFGKAKFVKQATGLPIDSYFSATKMQWLINNNKSVASALKKGTLLFGTINTYIAYVLTKGKSFVIDHTNACRTLLYNIKTKSWDPKLCKLFNIPIETLPRLIACDEPYGKITISKKTINLGGMIGDQQSSLVGQGCVKVGDFKTTYGTGAFTLTNIGGTLNIQPNLLTSIAYVTNKETAYCIEGSMYTAGYCMEWLINSIGIAKDYEEINKLADSVSNTGGVVFVPALAGIGAPFFKSNARAMWVGMSQATTKAHLYRAMLNGVAFNIKAMFDEMSKSTQLNKTGMCVDGGMTKNKTLMKLQANILGIPVNVSFEPESTALGAVYMTGLCFGTFKNLAEIKNLYRKGEVFKPSKSTDIATDYQNWLNIIKNM